MPIPGPGLYVYPPGPVTLGAIRPDRSNRYSNPRLLSFIDACLGSHRGIGIPTVAFKNSELAGAEPFTRDVETIDRQPAAQDLTNRSGTTGHALFKAKIVQGGQLVRRKHDLQPGEALLLPRPNRVGFFHRPSLTNNEDRRQKIYRIAAKGSIGVI